MNILTAIALFHICLSLQLKVYAQRQQWFQWQEINYAPQYITPRERHAGVYFPQTNEYLFVGGLYYDAFLEGLYSINLTSLKYSQIAATTPLGGRALMAYSSNPVSGDFYVHGGSGSGYCMI